MKGSDRNKKCPCGSDKKWKDCCPDFNVENMEKNVGGKISVPKEVIDYFNGIKNEEKFLKKIGIHHDYKGSITRIRDGYIVPLENSIFEIKTEEALNFYEIIGIIATETLGNDWIEEEGKKDAKDRSEIYQIISILGATDTFSKVISYTGKKINSPSIPNSGFSKNFLTLAFDIFCLRRHALLPEKLAERLKHFDQYQGARYEIAVAAIFCRLGYNIEWIDDDKTKQKHPEFIATKDGKSVYVEAKSRHIDGVHNRPGVFNELKAFKSTGWGSLIFKALQKEVPKGIPYFVFIDMNAINDGNMPPGWLEDVRKTLAKQHLKQYSGKKAPFTAIMFTNYSYHYQGLNNAEMGVCFAYENDETGRPYSSINEKINIMDAVKHYGFIPDYSIPGPRTMIHVSSEHAVINNIPNFY
ncbi:MAG: hypothetical protein US63_C0003G0009 [Candidatus Moranbacteria bacterium GW2011_GWC2_37_8]|nr:MAG: hypothetical protein US63_C0003G0009 [Candidatus Moranbacteria bacterium GW2011_GWC2_37_8]KKQ63214.1 MAG: hypothetical protein US82_C0002G0009 [Parcubacteria group bacterium GW2011_GWC1_38_22]